MSKRTKARETLMQLVFQMEARNSSDEELTTPVLEEKGTDKKQEEFIKENFKAIADNLGEIDALIEANSLKWKLSRIPKTDLAIMRVAIGESKYGTGTPAEVAINEAVELAKEYCGEKSPSFINGVLGKALS